MNLSRSRGPLCSGLIVLALVTVALHVALFRISNSPAPRPGFGDEHRYLIDARQILSGSAASPHPIWPPLYSRFLAGILAVGGDLFALEVVQTLMLLALALILGDLSCHLSGSRLSGLVAGGLVPVYPPLAAFAHYRWPEVLHLLLFIAALWLLVRRAERPAWLLAAGLLLGLAIQTKQLLWPFLPVLLLPLTLRGTPRQRVLRPALVVLAIGFTLAPGAYQNRDISLGARLLTSPMFNLWVGVNDRSRQSFIDSIVGEEITAYDRSADSYAQRNRILSEKLGSLLRERGLPRLMWSQLNRQYFRLFDKDSFLTDQLPAGDDAAVRKKGYAAPANLVIARSLRWSSYVLYSLVLIGAVLGMVVCPHRGRRWLLVGLAFLAYNLVIFFFLHVKSRYRIQLLPFLFFYTGCAASWTASRLGMFTGDAPCWKQYVSPGAWQAATVGVALLLFLAWGRPLLG